MKTKKQLVDKAINNLGNKFEQLKKELYKFPLTYSLQLSIEKGYTIVVNLEYHFEVNPIEWSKDPHASKPHVKIRD